MDTAIPILIAASVIMLVWGIAQVVSAAFDPDRRRLQRRLAIGAAAQSEGGQRSIVQQAETTGLSARLATLPALRTLQGRLLQAWPETSLAKFLMISGSAATCGFMLALLLSGSLLVGAVMGTLGGVIPFLLLTNKRNRRQKLMSEQIPEALDFLSRVLRAGHSLSTGFQMMGEELPKPIGAEFRRAYDQHSLGQSLENALREMARRIESTDFAFFVTAVLIQRQTGGDLSEVLNNISGMIRQRIRLQSHVKAKTAEGRFTGYILVAFPAAMFVLLSILNPAYAKTLTNTDTGQKLLLLAFVLQVMGLWMIRKLTTVRV